MASGNGARVIRPDSASTGAVRFAGGSTRKVEPFTVWTGEKWHEPSPADNDGLRTGVHLFRETDLNLLAFGQRSAKLSQAAVAIGFSGHPGSRASSWSVAAI